MLNLSGRAVHIVDDDEAVRDSFEALLLVAGFDVVTYSSAEAFLASARDVSGCVVADVNMPGMSGLELVEALAHRARELPVILLTASREERLRVRAQELGASGFLLKPVTDSDLLRAIRDAGVEPSASE